MKINTPQAAPHVRNPGRVPSLMGTVFIALIPTTLFSIYQFGWPTLNLIVLCLISALVFEALCLHFAGKSVRTFIEDGSGILTALLLALSLPPWAPWWIAISGSGFAVVVGKQIFGGIGQNPFNPAMLARVVLLLSFPIEMTTWVAPSPLFSTASISFMEGIQITFMAGHSAFDGLSGATLLGQVKTELSQGLPLEEILNDNYHLWSSSVGTTAGSLGETSALLIALGGLYLLYHRIISWHLPVSLLTSLTLLCGGFYLLDPHAYANPLLHLSSGGLMLGAFFIITDPVTSPCTARGQLFFGAGCGILIFVIRTWGGYPEGVAFAVLLMNALTPLIDHYIRPRRYGRTPGGKPIPSPLYRKLKSFRIKFPNKKPPTGGVK